MRTKRLVVSVAAMIALLAAAGPGPAQELDETRERLELAKQRLEEAAREVARLSAEAAEPVIRAFNLRFPDFGRRAMLGVGIEDAEQGVRVVGVTPGGGAAEAGMRTGDVIVAIDGAELGGSDDSASELLIRQMANVEPGEEVSLRVLRDGEPRELVVTARGMDAGPFRGPGPGFGRDGPGFRFPGVFAGRFRELELVSLTPELGAYFGTEQGLLVVRAPREENLELRDGDVILDINGRTPTSPEHAMRILASFEPDETLRLSIMRQQRRQTLEFTLPAPPRPG